MFGYELKCLDLPSIFKAWERNYFRIPALSSYTYKSVIYDMSAALKLAQNDEEQKEQRGLGGGEEVGRKNNTDPQAE